MEQLLKTGKGKGTGPWRSFASILNSCSIILRISFSEALNKDILAQGELLSTKLFSVYLEEKGIPHVLLPALEFMQIDAEDEPQLDLIRLRLTELLAKYPDIKSFYNPGIYLPECKRRSG